MLNMRKFAFTIIVVFVIIIAIIITIILSSSSQLFLLCFLKVSEEYYGVVSAENLIPEGENVPVTGKNR